MRIKKFGGGNLEITKNGQLFLVKYHYDGKYSSGWTLAIGESIIDSFETKRDAINAVKCR